MRRRDFIRTTTLFGIGIAAGVPDMLFNEPAMALASNHSLPAQSRFVFPSGGCTEAGIALFDKGPFGRDPFRIYE